MVLLHVQLGFLRSHQNGGFVGGDDHLVTHVGSGCSCDRLTQALGCHLLKGIGHLAERTVDLECFHFGHKSPRDGLAKLLRRLRVRHTAGEPHGDKKNGENIEACHGTPLFIHASEQKDTSLGAAPEAEGVGVLCEVEN